MNWRLAALILLGTACQTMPHQISMTVVQPGGDFSLSCSVGTNKAGLFYWYKLKFGYSVQKVAGGSFQTLKLEEQFENSRVEVSQKDTVYFLNIRNVSKEDEATYFCQAGTAYEMIVLNGSLLAVNDHQNHQRSVYVKQRPETRSVQTGDSVSLQCSLLFKYKETRVQCPHEHNVYWFRAGSGESPLGVVYTHKSRSFKEDEERGCIYSLSKTIQNSSDAGTYYCAVVTCGEILFGEGTTVQTRDTSLLYIALGVLLPYCVFVTAALIISRNQKPVCGQCKGEITASSQGEHYRSAEAHQNYQDSEEAALNYVALDFARRKTQRWTKTRELQQDCTYSGVGECL